VVADTSRIGTPGCTSWALARLFQMERHVLRQEVDFGQEHQLGLGKDGYLSGLSSPSVTLKRTTFASSPRS
jgi:hypothetical protein